VNLIAKDNTTDAAQSLRLADRRATMREFVEKCSDDMLADLERVSGINQTNERKDQ
jgi:hypothetical protein